MLSTVRKGFMILGREHWEQVIELTIPLLLKFKYKTDAFCDAVIDLSLLDY